MRRLPRRDDGRRCALLPKSSRPVPTIRVDPLADRSRRDALGGSPRIELVARSTGGALLTIRNPQSTSTERPIFLRLPKSARGERLVTRRGCYWPADADHAGPKSNFIREIFLRNKREQLDYLKRRVARTMLRTHATEVEHFADASLAPPVASGPYVVADMSGPASGSRFGEISSSRQNGLGSGKNQF